MRDYFSDTPFIDRCSFDVEAMIVILCMKRRKMEPVSLWGIVLDENSILRDPRNIVRVANNRGTRCLNFPWN